MMLLSLCSYLLLFVFQRELGRELIEGLLEVLGHHDSLGIVLVRLLSGLRILLPLL